MKSFFLRESRRKTPTVVCLKENERLFGDSALAVVWCSFGFQTDSGHHLNYITIVCCPLFVFQSVKNPKTVYRHLQSLLGKKHDNLQVKGYQRCFPEHQLQGDPVRGTVYFNSSLWVFTSLFFSVSTFIYSCFYLILKIAALSEELMETSKRNKCWVPIPRFACMLQTLK